MKFIDYLKTFPLVGSENSTKLLALLLSAIGGSILTLVIAFVLVWDVCVDGKIDTDLIDLGVFLLCDAGLILGSGIGVKVPKALEKRLMGKNETTEE